MACTFQATIGGKIATLIGRRDDDMCIDTCSMITTYNITDAPSEILPSRHMTSYGRRCDVMTSHRRHVPDGLE